jgi:hypothetical protein
MIQSIARGCGWLCILACVAPAQAQDPPPQMGREVAIPLHLQDGEEFSTPIRWLIQYGEQLFNAKFTIQEGAGRPLSKGTGAPLSDPTSPLLFPNNFDRVSSPEANACFGCHEMVARHVSWSTQSKTGTVQFIQ